MREAHGILPVPSPEPVAIGAPGAGFPLTWSLQTWVPGAPATDRSAAASVLLAPDLTTLLAALRSAPTHGRTFGGSGRGGHVPDQAPWVQECLDRSGDLLDVPALRRL